MIVKHNYDLYECEILNIYNGKVVLNRMDISLNKLDIIAEDHEIKLYDLYKSLQRINRKYKLKDYAISLREDYDNMEVNIEYSNNKIKEMTIIIGMEFIYNFTEEEILVYISHEIGHILDFDYTMKSNRYLELIKEFGKITSTLVIPPLIYFYLEDDMFLVLKFLISIITFNLIFKGVFKYLKAFFNRKQEYNADSLAVSITGDVTKVIDAFLVLQDYKGLYDDKSSIFSTHPSLNQRIKYLKTRYFYHYIWKFFFG